MSKTALITGISGQDGSYLADLLVKKKYRVIGISSSKAAGHWWRLDYFKIRKKIRLVIGSVDDPQFMERTIRANKPDELYNLAGQSSVARSWEEPVETMRINGFSAVQMLDIVRRVSPASRFFQAGSAEMYGNIHGRITEQAAAFAPLHPYGTAKLFAHLSVRNFREQYGLFAVNGVMFNHESPLRDERFVTRRVVREAARIQRGEIDFFTLGNLAPRRDFCFAGDVVRAMWMMLQQRRPRDYVICSGATHPISDFVAEVFKQCGRKDWKRHIKTDPRLVRKAEVRDMRGSSALIRRELGWRPTVDFKALVRMMVAHELKQKSPV